jgi:hypothetical protein
MDAAVGIGLLIATMLSPARVWWGVHGISVSSVFELFSPAGEFDRAPEFDRHAATSASGDRRLIWNNHLFRYVF